MRSFRFLVYGCLLAISALCSTSAAARITDEALRALWQQGDLHRMQELAEQGDVRAQHWLGLMLHNRGRYNEATHWYERAVRQGDGRSANRIAFFYEQGLGRPRDLAAATAWYQRGAALGDTESQIRYASALQNGTGILRDEAAAFRWYARAARQGNSRIQLGYAYLPLAEMFARGTGTARNPVQAYAFARVAELTVDDSDAQSRTKARELQAEMAALLSPSDREAANQVLKELRPDLAPSTTLPGPALWAGLCLIIVIVAAGFIFLRRRGSAARELS